MPYIAIDNFAAGLDVRKSALTSAPGTLQRLVNATISPGGEIVKRKAFVKIATLTGTFGLAATESTVYAFTHDTVPPALPAFAVPGVTLAYQRLNNNSASVRQTDYDTFNGKIYLATFDPTGPVNNQIFHFYDGLVVPQASAGNAKGMYVRTYRTKVYAVYGQHLNFSKLGDPTDWVDAVTPPAVPSAGFINLANNDSGGELLTSLEVYYDKLSVFSSVATQLWSVDPDPTQNNLDQILQSSGTIAPLSAKQYGSGDVLYLATSGIRSVRARDSSNAAAVSDIGSPIDNLIQDIYATKGAGYFSSAKALLEPIVGRFWMIFPNEIYALSAFPGPKITAWSRYTTVAGTTPFTIDYAVTCGGRIFFRAGDDLYVYGGNSGQDYDNCGVEVRLPYLDMGKPATNKIFQSIDATMQGTWTIKNSFDYNNPDTNEETLGTFSTPTWRDGKAAFEGQSTHFSLRFYNTDANAALISNAAVHYALADEEA